MEKNEGKMLDRRNLISVPLKTSSIKGDVPGGAFIYLTWVCFTLASENVFAQTG